MRFGKRAGRDRGLARSGAARGGPHDCASRRWHRPRPSRARWRQLGARYLFADDGEYPALLGHIDNAPPVLTVAGDTDAAARPAIAMVGARNASAAACRFARQIAGELVEAGYLVVSGLARGIDTAAHEGAMRIAGNGPAPHGRRDRIGDRHQLPAGERAAAGRDGRARRWSSPNSRPAPNRWRATFRIATASSPAWRIGTLVVEAAPQSGSLITARLAAEAGRDVMAIPGSPLDSRSRGCNELIRGGATLVQSVADILELIAPFAGSQPQRVAAPSQRLLRRTALPRTR